MEYHIAKPSLFLSRFVKHYWTIENCLPFGQHHTQRIVPNGLQELLFYLGDRPRSNDDTKLINENAVVAGHLNEFYDLQVSGNLSLFSILFKPHGLNMFFDIPPIELSNKIVPLKHILKQETPELEDLLFEAKSFSERIVIVENCLFKLLQRNGNNYYSDRVEHCIRIINQHQGLVNIDFLASEACLSRKQFERIFSQYVGTSPKQLLKTVRFQNALDKKSKDSSKSLTDLTFTCGYYDQSHMINDFQKLTGLTPKQYFNECEAYSDYFH